ncbi:MAG: hypothetical protein CSA61_00970 [Neptuniibacter caesariensis]|uniref:Uncharacterized protein n=1 Tax=Neptuniibacter caesariensis TaxID=207954 RepID=A0A2G6JBG9_NEPCE|nr:MAG: hypothetical protein CSA61_00970 [Neptuniibacter caesariensis]
MPQKTLKNLATLFLLVTIPAALFAGAYGFVWWKTQAFADDLAQEMAPFAEMEYGDIYIDLFNSELGLQRITFAPVGMEGVIEVGSATLKAPSWGFVLDLDAKLSKGDFPEAFNVDLKGISIDLESGYVQDWARMAEDMQRQSGKGSGYDVLGCGKREYFSVSDLRKMGYSEITSDIALQYSFDAIDQQLNFDMQSTVNAVANMSVSMSLAVASDALNMQTIMLAQPQLKRIEMRYSDRGYNLRKNNFCAQETAVTVDDYREKYRDLLSKRLQYEGWVVPEQLFSAFDGMNNPGGSAYVRVDVPNGFGVQSMAMVQKATDLIDMLSPYIEFNGKPVRMDGLAWVEPDPQGQRLLRELQGSAAGEAPAGSDHIAEDGAIGEGKNLASTETLKQRERRRHLERLKADKTKSFKATKIADLAAYLGRPIVLYTYFGYKVEGHLVSVKDNIVTVEHRLATGKGTATYPIAADKIQSVKLYR